MHGLVWVLETPLQLSGAMLSDLYTLISLRSVVLQCSDLPKETCGRI